MAHARQSVMAGSCLLLCGMAIAHEPLFPGEFEFQWPTAARFMEAGDFNDDGRPDLALVASDGSGVVVFGLPGGAFNVGEALAFDVVSVVGLLSADFNADGFVDLAAAGDDSTSSTPGFVSIALGYGDGTFQPSTRFEVVGRPRMMAAGDLNGDGVPDLVVLDNLGDRVIALLGNGDGSFQDQVDTPLAIPPKRLAPGDLNADGLTDLAVTVSDSAGNGGVVPLLSTGDGSFIVGDLRETGRYPGGVVVTDLDLDGENDAVVRAQYGAGFDAAYEYALLPGDGLGGLGADVRLGPCGTGLRIDLADLDADGIDDLVMPGNLSGSVGVRMREPDGTPKALREFGAGPDLLDLAIADFDGDHAADAMVSVGAGEYMLLRGDGGGTLRARLRLQTQTPTSDVLAVDLDGDGALDLVGANHGFYGFEVNEPGDVLSVFLGDGSGGYTPAPDLPSVWAPQHLTQADFNADLVPDIAVSSTQGANLTVFIGVGDGSFEPGRTGGSVRYTRKGVAADFNGDGSVDLALATSADGGSIHILPGLGDGTFAEPVATPVGGLVQAVAGGDMNADGYLDLVIARSGLESLLLLSNADATFVPNPLPGTSGCSAVSVVDYNRDGHPDILAARTGAQEGTSDLIAIPADGLGGFGPPVVSVLQEESPMCLMPGDFDADARVDLAVSFLGSTSIHLIFGNGSGAFDGLRRFMGGGSLGTTQMTAADLDQDGDLDLVGGQSCFPFGIGGADSCDHEMVVLLNATPMPLACNPSDLAPPFGVLNFDDVLAFLSAYAAGDPLADLAPAYGELNFNDVLIFLVVFVEGCDETGSDDPAPDRQPRSPGHRHLGAGQTPSRP